MLRPRHLSYQLLYSGDLSASDGAWGGSRGQYYFPENRDSLQYTYPGTRDSIQYNYPETRDSIQYKYPGTRNSIQYNYPAARDSHQYNYSRTSAHYRNSIIEDRRMYRYESTIRLGHWRSPAILDKFIQVVLLFSLA